MKKQIAEGNSEQASPSGIGVLIYIQNKQSNVLIPPETFEMCIGVHFDKP